MEIECIAGPLWWFTSCISMLDKLVVQWSNIAIDPYAEQMTYNP